MTSARYVPASNLNSGTDSADESNVTVDYTNGPFKLLPTNVTFEGQATEAMHDIRRWRSDAKFFELAKATFSRTRYPTIQADSSHSQFSSRVKPRAVLSRGGPEEQLRSLCLNSSSFADVSSHLVVCFPLLSDG
jgi:hypothetical protein